MSARIVFDLDGTLIDSAPDIRGIANAVLEAMGVAPITLADTRNFIGEGIGVFVEKLRAARDIPDSEQSVILGQILARYDDAVTLTQPYPGVPDVLTLLARDHRLGICTNKPYRPTIAVLAHLGLERHFGAILGGDNRFGRKPEPAGLLATFEVLGTGPCVYVGDSEVDAETAHRASVPFLLFTEGYRKRPVEDIRCDAHFDAFENLPDLISKI